MPFTHLIKPINDIHSSKINNRSYYKKILQSITKWETWVLLTELKKAATISTRSKSHLTIKTEVGNFDGFEASELAAYIRSMCRKQPTHGPTKEQTSTSKTQPYGKHNS